MDTGDKRAVATSFRLLTQHLLNYTTYVKGQDLRVILKLCFSSDQTGNDFYEILNKLISNNCLLHWIKVPFGVSKTTRI